MSSTNNTNRTITLEITPPHARVTLVDNLYASMTASTGSPAVDTHNCNISIEGGLVNLHFRDVYLCMSLADWHRVAVAVAGIEDSAVAS